MTGQHPFDGGMLPPGIRARFIDNGNGLKMHVLEAGFEDAGRPCVLLLHGFPELAYSWRKVMPALAAAGYHVIAPDQRGYGRTSGWDGDYRGDLGAYAMANLVRDAVGLLAALGRDSVAAVVGHDFGSPVAAYSALTRPDVFRAVVLMSATFTGPPAFNDPGDDVDIHQALASLDPPRKHYKWYYSTLEANDNMWRCPQGVHAFLRAYYHHKSADWAANRPFELASWTAGQLALLPTYYVMERDRGMAETVAGEMPSPEHIAACAWLPEDELRVYSDEFGRTGFQGGLQWYRCATDARCNRDLERHAGRTIDVPSCFIAGASDWGAYQSPGALKRMQTEACTDMRGFHLLTGAGHWVQQEQPAEVSAALVAFLAEVAS
ncbi:MAG: alpha/beta hydrolase [Alphaproteobacteria bacterium]